MKYLAQLRRAGLEHEDSHSGAPPEPPELSSVSFDGEGTPSIGKSEALTGDAGSANSDKTPLAQQHVIIPEKNKNLGTCTAKTDRTHRSNIANDASDLDTAMERRRQRVISILEKSAPSVQRAFDVTYVGDQAIIAVAIRCIATAEMVVPRAKFDGIAFAAFLDAQGASH